MRKDLVDVGDEDFHIRQGEFMLCLDCREKIGGTQGDYWTLGMNDVIYCPNCESDNIALVVDVTTTKVIKS